MITRRLVVHMKVSSLHLFLPFAWPCKGKACASLVPFACPHALAQRKEICMGLGYITAGFTWHRQKLGAERMMLTERLLLAMMFMQRNTACVSEHRTT